MNALPGGGAGLHPHLPAMMCVSNWRSQSEAGAGAVQLRRRSAFIVRLLLSDVRPEVTHCAAAAENLRLRRYPRQKILLVDDDPSHLDLVQNLLRPLGFTLFVARDGKTGNCARHPVPARSGDDRSQPPDISGWTVAGELRENVATGPH